MTPPATRREVETWYPEALVEDATAAALVDAWMDARGETCPQVRGEILDRAAHDPEALDDYRRVAVAAGVAAPAPVTCATCRHFQPNPSTPEAGFGRCTIAAPASLRSPTLWLLAEHRCRHWIGPV